MMPWVKNLQAVVKTVGTKLVPFFKTVAIYFVVFIPDNQPSWYATVLKCLPIVSLMFFVFWHMKSIGQRWTYSSLILAGQFASCIGDACLVYDESYLSGIASFAVAQVCYISAFKIRPFAPLLMLLMSAVHLTTFYFMWPALHGALVIAMPVYGILVTTMAYRAIDEFLTHPPRWSLTIEFVFQNDWDGGKLCAAIGGALFVLSDAIIGLNAFYSPIPYHQVSFFWVLGHIVARCYLQQTLICVSPYQGNVLIMLTYYAAQLGIALSVIDSMEICEPEASIRTKKDSRRECRYFTMNMSVASLWIGDLTEYMDENFLSQACSAMGEYSVRGVKVIRQKFTGKSMGYGFLQFNDESGAMETLARLQGKVIPNTNPPVRFKLNHGVYKKTAEKEFSLWVGDIDKEVGEDELFRAFVARYTSIRTARILRLVTGQSKGYGFVRFSSEDEYKDALVQMNGYRGLGSRPIKVSPAIPRKDADGNETTLPPTYGSAQTHTPATSSSTPATDYSYYYDTSSMWSNATGWENYDAMSEAYYGTAGVGTAEHYQAHSTVDPQAAVVANGTVADEDDEYALI
ncbi:unnamed protein product, partial [Notodromas monacha]